MTAFPDWVAILPDTGAALALSEDPDFLASQPTRARGAFLRLAEVPAALARRDDTTAPAEVHADVLRIEGSVEFALPSLVLHARRVEVAAGAALVLHAPDPAAPACRVAIHVDEWAFAPGMTALPLTVAEVPHALAPPPGVRRIEAGLANDGSFALRESAGPGPGDALTGRIALDAARRLALSPQLDAAWSHELPLAIADWVARTGGEPMLRVEARGLAAHWRSPRGERPFVPYLQLGEYQSLAVTTRDALGAAELAYARLFDRQLSIKDQKQAGLHVLEHYRSAKAYADRLTGQSREGLAQAQAAGDRAQRLLDERKAEIEQLQKAFEQGIEDKRGELTRQAVFEVILGVALVAGGIAMAFYSGPAGVAGAAAGAEQAAKAGAQAAGKMKALVDLLAKVAKVLDAIGKLKGYLALLKAALDVIDDVAHARTCAEAAGDGLPAPPADTMSAADWDEFLVALDVSFAPALELGVGGASELLLGLKKLAVRGKDVVATQSLLVHAQQQVQQHLWQALRDEADTADMRRRLDALDTRRGPGLVLMTHYAALRDRLKLRLVGAIARVADAYRYEALAEPAFAPTMASGGPELAAMLADVEQALVQARERRGTVSDWGPERLELSDAAALAALQRGRAMSFMVDMDNFAGLDRIRVADIRIWLRGADSVGRLRVDIATSGDYDDRLRGQRFAFATWPLQRGFAYERDPHGDARDAWGAPVRITLHANDAEGDFFQPTAFSTWTLTLPTELNPGLDPSSITGVALEFVGTAVPGRARARGLRARGPGTGLLFKAMAL